MSNNSDSGAYTRGFVLGALFGGLAGAAVALLFAPKSGAELRKDLAQRSSEFYDKASDYFGEIDGKVGHAVQSTVNEGRQRAENIISSAKKQAEDIKSNAEKILDDARSKASSMKEQVHSKFDHLRDAAKASADAFKSELEEAKSDSGEDQA